MRGMERPRESERVDIWSDRVEVWLPYGVIVELAEPWAVAIALERALQPVDALWLISDGTAARYLSGPATGLTARWIDDIAMRGGGRHGHVQRSEGE